MEPARDPSGFAILDGRPEITCPHCGHRVGIQAVTLQLAGEDRPQRIELDLRQQEVSLPTVVNDVKRRLVVRALRQANGVKARAAEIAGMKYTTFFELMQRLEITDEEIGASRR